WRHAFVASFPNAANDERSTAEEAAKWAGVTPTVLEVARDDALDQIDRILDDSDDVYISLSTAPWLIYRELRRHKVLVSLDGHGADELMGAYLQEGESWDFRLRNLVARGKMASSAGRRVVDFLRAIAIMRQGYWFLRGGLRDIPAPLDLTGQDDALPHEWGGL